MSSATASTILFSKELIQSATEKETGGVVGSGDPSVPSLSQFVYGGTDFPEESKNTNDLSILENYKSTKIKNLKT